MTKSPSVGKGGFIRTGWDERSLSGARAVIGFDVSTGWPEGEWPEGEWPEGEWPEGDSSGKMESKPINIG